MAGSIGSSSSRRHRTVTRAAAYFMISSIADQAVKISICVARNVATYFWIGITTATVTIPAKNASAMRRRGSGCGASSRRQNHSHARAGNTPPATAPSIGVNSCMRGILTRPRSDHQQIGLFLGKLFPDGLGDERHEGVEKFQRYQKNFIQGRRAALPRGGIRALENWLRLFKNLRREAVPHEVIGDIGRKIEAKFFDVPGNVL